MRRRRRRRENEEVANGGNCGGGGGRVKKKKREREKRSHKINAGLKEMWVTYDKAPRLYAPIGERGVLHLYPPLESGPTFGPIFGPSNLGTY